MAQQQSPWLEGVYGWNFGEGGWNTGMDSNLLKFSFMFDRNVDSVVASLPAAVNGQAHYLTTDNRLYFAVGTTYFSTPVPKWFEFKDRSTGNTYQFDGVSSTQIDSPTQIDNRLEAVELTVASLGTAAFEDIGFFATQPELDIATATAATYTDDLRGDLTSSDLLEGANLVGRAVRNIDSVDELKLLTGRFNGETVTVSSFYSGWEALVPPVPDGGGLFVWNATSTATEVTGHIVKASVTTTGRWFRVLDGNGIYEVTWSGVRSGAGFESTNTTLLNELITYVDPGAKFYFPLGLVHINTTLTIDKAISFIGRDKLRSGLYGIGFAQDVPLVDYAGTTSSRIQDIEFHRFSFWSDNNLARGVNLTWVNKSSFEDIYFYQLYRGVAGSNSWGNNFKNASTFSITQATMTFGEECNNLVFERVEARGIDGIVFNSSAHGLEFVGCDFEGITDQTGRGILFAPVSSKKISGIKIDGCYFENIQGAALSCAGTDVNSVQGLSMTGCYISGGFQDYFSSVTGNATHALILTNVQGVTLANNHFEDWETSALFLNGTEGSCVVRDNTGNRVADLSNIGFTASVKVANNFKGRKEEWNTTIPVSGFYTIGDVVHNTAPSKDANSMTLTGWSRLTTGTSHVEGTDWVRMFVSHLSPSV